MEPLYGVLDMLVLRTLLFGPRRGYGVAAAIRDSSRDAVTIEFGSLYPALKRLELKGWTASKWERPSTIAGPRSTASHRPAGSGKTEWAKFVAGVAMIMNPAAGEVD